MRRPSLIAAVATLVLITACTDKAPPQPRTVQGAQQPRDDARTASNAQPASTPPTQPADPKPEPPYDLATDQQRRIRTAKEELGGRTVTTIISDVFVVIGPLGWQGAQFDQSVALFRSSMAGYMNGRFSKKPERAVSVYLFPTKAAYESFCKQK
jgi:hypothetical protein